MGKDIPYIPNIKSGGICIGSKIAPIFFNTMEDSGALPIELDVSCLNMGDIIDIYPKEGKLCRHGSNDILVNFSLKSPVLLDEVRAGGRIPLIIGRGITSNARLALGNHISISDIFQLPEELLDQNKPSGFTLAQKIVGKACGVEGIVPGQYCEPVMTTVGSQDTTGPMTRDELRDLACLGFSFPAGSGLVAFAAVAGIMPLDMP